MSARTAYVDTSAFVKILLPEPQSAALRERLLRWPDRASAALLRTEAVRALRRSGNDHMVSAARQLIAGIRLIRIDETLLDQAADLPPSVLRSLDAIHLSAALSMREDLDVLFTYDERLQQAAVSQGITVESPS